MGNYEQEENARIAKASWYVTKIIIPSITLLLLLIILGMWGCPNYSVYQQNLEGKAELAKKEQYDNSL